MVKTFLPRTPRGCLPGFPPGVVFFFFFFFFFYFSPLQKGFVALRAFFAEEKGAVTHHGWGGPPHIPVTWFSSVMPSFSRLLDRLFGFPGTTLLCERLK